MTRTDTHAPSKLIPAEYHSVLIFSRGNPEKLEPAFAKEEALAMYLGGSVEHGKLGAYWKPGEGGRGARIHGGVFSCDICGASYNYGALFEHEPTGEIISVGWICATKLDLAFNLSEAEELKGRAKRSSLRALERLGRRIDLRLWVEEHRDLARALKTDHDIVRDIRARLIRWPHKGLSERQEALVWKLHHEANREPERHVPAPVVDGRVTVTGKVVSVKWHENGYGGALKMTVKVETPDGSWLAWGTVPSALEREARAAFDAAHEAALDAYKAERETVDREDDEALDALEEAHRAIFEEFKDSSTARLLKGHTVRFDAKLVAGRDPHFAIFKRPTKSSLLD